LRAAPGLNVNIERGAAGIGADGRVFHPQQTLILGESQPRLAILALATHVVSNATEFQIAPQVGARGIHKLEAQTPVAVVHSEQGWVLVAKDGKLLGYVAQGDLTPTP
jgi:hypothetical protein